MALGLLIVRHTKERCVRKNTRRPEGQKYESEKDKTEKGGDSTAERRR